MVGMALKSEFGERAFDLWDEWSRQSDKYQPKVMRQQWKSFKDKTGGVTIGSLFREARICGWDLERSVKLDHRGPRSQLPPPPNPQEEEEIIRAAHQAELIVHSARWSTHRYFRAKKLPKHQGLVDDNGALIVPIRTIHGFIKSVQIISGKKKRFLPGSKVRNGCYKMSVTNAPDAAWLCEGYATGLTIHAALRSVSNKDDVIVCFSAHNITNMSKVCRRYYQRTGTALIIAADNDIAGRRAVEQSERDGEWFPPPNMDANDYYQSIGCNLNRLTEELVQQRQRVLEDPMP